MNQQQIFYSTDFEATLKADGMSYARPFELLFFATKRSRSFTASYDGTTYRNCKLNQDGTLTVYFDHHNMGIGTLRMQRKYSSASAMYGDGSFDTVTPPEQPIFNNDKGDYTIIIDTVNAWTYDEEPQPEPGPEPEEPATLNASVSTISAAGGEAVMIATSTKVGDVITIKDFPSESWVSITDNGDNTFNVSLHPTTDLSARSTIVTLINSQGITIDCPINQASAVIEAYGEWSLTMTNVDKSIDYKQQTIALAASATRNDTYNNGITKAVTGNVVWSSSQGWASVGGMTLNVSKCVRVSQSREATITASVASVGGNALKSASFKVTQSVMPEIVLQPNSLTGITANGATKTFTATKYGTVGTLSVSSDKTSVATATIAGDTVTVVVSENTAMTEQQATITVTDGTESATCPVRQQKAVLKLYWGYSAAVPTEIDATNSDTLSNGIAKTITTTSANKAKCHWVAARTASGFNIKSWLDKLDSDLNGLGKIKSTTIGDYKVYYLLSAGYIANSSRITINA